jgi:hypothetical protein
MMKRDEQALDLGSAMVMVCTTTSVLAFGFIAVFSGSLDTPWQNMVFLSCGIGLGLSLVFAGLAVFRVQCVVCGACVSGFWQHTCQDCLQDCFRG